MGSGYLKGKWNLIKRVVVCDQCKKEIEVRSGIFANTTLSRHNKMEHK